MALVYDERPTLRHSSNRAGLNATWCAAVPYTSKDIRSLQEHTVAWDSSVRVSVTQRRVKLAA